MSSSSVAMNDGRGPTGPADRPAILCIAADRRGPSATDEQAASQRSQIANAQMRNHVTSGAEGTLDGTTPTRNHVWVTEDPHAASNAPAGYTPSKSCARLVWTTFALSQNGCGLCIPVIMQSI